MGSAAFESRPRMYCAFSTAWMGGTLTSWAALRQGRSSRVDFVDIHELQPGGMQTRVHDLSDTPQ
jgi:hypothetical protein